jgi:hypothetical protein
MLKAVASINVVRRLMAVSDHALSHRSPVFQQTNARLFFLIRL